MILCFGIGALWDGVTTILGIASIIRADTYLGYALCAVGGVVILGFTMGTKLIFSASTVFSILKIFWFVAIVFDGYTSLVGNANYIILKRSILELADVRNTFGSLLQLNPDQILVVLVLTVLVTGSPVVVSYLTQENNSQANDGYPTSGYYIVEGEQHDKPLLTTPPLSNSKKHIPSITWGLLILSIFLIVWMVMGYIGSNDSSFLTTPTPPTTPTPMSVPLAP